MVLQRGWRIAICLLLCVCMAFSCVAPVYAAAILPVVAFGSLAVIAAVLVATGVMSSNDADFDGLCNDIYDGLSAASKIGPKITLGVMAGISYLHTSIVEMITAEAVKQGAYTPIAGGSTIEVDGYSYPVYADEAAAIADFVPVASFVDSSLSHTKGEILSVPVAAPYYWEISYDINHPMNLFDEDGVIACFTSSFCLSLDVKLGSVVFLESEQWLFALVSDYPRIRAIRLFNEPTEIGSISVRFPWELTDDLPSISSSGVLDRVNAGWLARERAIDGTASLPLSVPADTVAGAAAQTQADAQSGTKTKDVVNESTKDNALEELMKKGKMDISFVDIFPFCIPFDLIKGIKLLVAPAKAPVFDIPIKFPYIPEQTIHIDLAQYGGIAVFSRWFLTLAFVIGLAVGTSKVMKW